MKVCDIDRNLMYTVLHDGFQALQLRPRVAIARPLGSRTLVLVDAWSTASNRDYCPFDPLPAWIDPPEVYDFYFGGPTWEQATWDRLHDGCQQRFAGDARVRSSAPPRPTRCPPCASWPARPLSTSSMWMPATNMNMCCAT